MNPRRTDLTQAGKQHPFSGLRRRDFLIRFCQGAGASLVPNRLWGVLANDFDFASRQGTDAEFHYQPHYRSERPLDSTLSKVRTGLDEFINEKHAEAIGLILAEWSDALRRSPHDMRAVERFIADGFSGTSLKPISSRAVRSDALLELHQNNLGVVSLGRAEFLRDLESSIGSFEQIITAEFQITGIDSQPSSSSTTSRLNTRVRYEIVGAGPGFHREQRIGEWNMEWQCTASGDFHLRNWQGSNEVMSRARSPVYIDVASTAFGGNSSYAAQMMHGSDYWRTVLDGASGIDLYGHNGVSIADIDNDGFDDLYVCQPAGLPNRLYRNRGDGTFEDITESSGLGILDNTACALFADFNNRGCQDVILVRNSGPLLYTNDGKGKFHLKPDAFQFANAPQGTFTSAALADYDRDGWLDVYFCLYSYYEGTGQYKYPLPYHDAENGPPNFLMRNNRDGSFHDVTAQSGLNQNNTRYSFACAWNDYNRDGWPDLCVVNDFGRKNLYRNNGDGTFTDVASQAGVEDVGAGMSAGWLDYDNDGAEDLYVANMWTAAGLRVSMQDNFKSDSSPDIRALYQKHAMGNSLFRNAEKNFDDRTNSAGVGMGRWSWSSEAFDFDHDGFPDLYIVNGMVSGPSRQDLNSFFWRQVVSKSPDDARASKGYENGWQAINELIRSDGTWSGYERNVVYANNRDKTFSDVSAVVGLDFVEDGRAFALADFDHDGRQEICLKNRNAPQLRLLKNVAPDLPPSIVFRLQGTKSNRDAIGASVTIETDAGRRLTRTLQTGSGFLSQHSKEVFFGLGETTGTAHASIRWPSGLVQELKNIPINHRVGVVENAEPVRLEPFESVKAKATPTAAMIGESDTVLSTVETWLLAPIMAPDFSLPDSSGKVVTLSAYRGKTVLLNLCAPGSQKDLQTYQKEHARWSSNGLHLLTVEIQDSAALATSRQSPRNTYSFPLLAASDEVAAVYNILFRQLFDRHRDLILPTSFLITPQGEIVKVYRGAIDPEHVDKDFRTIPASDAERLARALPFPSSQHTLDFGRNYLSLGASFFQRGYLDQSEAAFQQASREDPSSAEALYGIGSVYLNQNKNDAARATFERAVKLQASYPATIPDSWNNLGVIATREARIDDSISNFQQALRVDTHHQAALDNLGNAYRLQKRWNDAREVLERAIELSPSDPEANYGLGMVFAQTDNPDKAYEYLQQAIKARPDYPEALNNLGVLYMVTHRRDEAVASFEKCIQVAPAFDQAYLNLARVYALDGARDRARTVLMDLLKQHPDHSEAKQMLDQLQQ